MSFPPDPSPVPAHWDYSIINGVSTATYPGAIVGQLSLNNGTLYPSEFGAKGNDLTFDSAPAINETLQAAVAQGLTLVDGAGLTYLIDSDIVQPKGIVLKNITLQIGTPGINALLVSDNDRFFGNIIGSGVSNIIERGIFPAAEDVTDVDIDADISNITVAIQGQTPTGDYDYGHAPKRWKISARIHDIVGDAGLSLGYGVLTSPAYSFQINGYFTNIARHAVYISAGSSDCSGVIYVDGCANLALHIYSEGTEAEGNGNQFTLFARNLSDNTGISAAAGVIGWNNNVNLEIHVDGSNAIKYAVTIEGDEVAGGKYPRNITIRDSVITGQFTGSDVIHCLNADAPILINNIIDAYAVDSVIGFRTTGVFEPIGRQTTMRGNSIDAQGQNIPCVYTEITQQLTDIELNDMGNNGTTLRVYDNTGSPSQRIGHSRECMFSGTSASIAPGTGGTVSITLQQAISLTNWAGTVSTTSPFTTASIIGRVDETHLTVEVVNNDSSAKTINFTGMIYGD